MDAPLTSRIRTADGLELAADLRAHPDPRAAVVVVHGLSGSRADRSVLTVAEGVYEAGFDVVTYDGRGHGDSGGLCTLGRLERLDVAAAVDLARTRCPDVLLVGASMGAIAALRYAAGDSSITAVVTVSSPARWRVPTTLAGLLSVLLTRTRLGRRLAAARLGARLAPQWLWSEPPVTLAARLPVPLVVIHGRRDRFIRHAEGQRLFDAATGPRRLEIVDGMGHAFDHRAVAAILEGLEWGVSQRASVAAASPASS